MKMANIMNYKLLLYIFDVLLCTYVVSAINFEKIIKKNKIVETKILVMIISFILAYLLTNFIFDFINYSKII